MPVNEGITNEEKYGHANMTGDELENRIAADLYELHQRLIKNDSTKSIGQLVWHLMIQFRQAYRTAKLIEEWK